MSLLDAASKARKPRPTHPTGWEPGVTFDGGTGILVPHPRPHDGTVAKPGAEPWEDHIRRAGLDPTLVEVVEPVEIRTWDAAVGNGVVQTMLYFRARVRSKDRRIDDEALRKWVRKWKPTKPKDTSGERTFVVVWADTQIGKDDGDGTKGTVERWMNSHGQAADRWQDVAKGSRIVVVSLGDIVEGCGSHYAQQRFRVELNEREQRRTARSVVVAGLKAFSDISDVTVLPVGGNHGEVRENGASVTDFSDNIDVALFEDAHDILTENERFSNVTFHVPRSDLTQTIDLHGTILGMAHGHQAKGGTGVEQKIMRWWRGQMEGRQPVGDADLLLTGHYHHLRVVQAGTRTWMQAPAMDGGSEWFEDVSGLDSPAGTLTFTVSEDGWDDLAILPGVRN